MKDSLIMKQAIVDATFRIRKDMEQKIIKDGNGNFTDEDRLRLEIYRDVFTVLNEMQKEMRG